MTDDRIYPTPTAQLTAENIEETYFCLWEAGKLIAQAQRSLALVMIHNREGNPAKNLNFKSAQADVTSALKELHKADRASGIITPGVLR